MRSELAGWPPPVELVAENVRPGASQALPGRNQGDFFHERHKYSPRFVNRQY